MLEQHLDWLARGFGPRLGSPVVEHRLAEQLAVCALDKGQIQVSRQELLTPVRPPVQDHTCNVEHELADQLLGPGNLEPSTPDRHHDRIQELVQGTRHPRNANHLARAAAVRP